VLAFLFLAYTHTHTQHAVVVCLLALLYKGEKSLRKDVKTTTRDNGKFFYVAKLEEKQMSEGVREEARGLKASYIIQLKYYVECDYFITFLHS